MKKLILQQTLSLVTAQVPQKMSFQAYLTDSNNAPIAPGEYEITFRIYDASTDGNKLWEETQIVDVDGSMVSTMLGNSVPLVTLNSAGFLEIQLKDEVLSPRQELGGSMFAVKAVNADTAKFVDLSDHRGFIRSVAKDNAKLSAYSTDNNSASYLSLIAQDKDGNQRELRVYNEGNNGGDFRFYDATKNKDLMVLDTTGALTAVKFVGDGSQLTGIAKTTDTDDQTLSISGDTLYISEGNNAILSQYKDNTDTQDLSFNSSTNILSLTDGGTVDLSNLNSVSGASSLNGLTDVLVETNSIYVGQDPSSTTNAASYNVAVGTTALDAVTTADKNVAVGHNALTSNTEGYANTSIGTESLESNTTGTENIAVGVNALESNTTGHSNLAMGYEALNKSTTASWNVAIGDSAMTENTTGWGNSVIGAKALGNNTTGSGNIAVGGDALKANTTANFNSALGTYALTANTTGQDNTSVGYASLAFNTTGSGNTAVGVGSLYENTTASYNTAIGYASLSANTTGVGNTAVGYGAISYNSTGSNNSAFGPSALFTNTTGSNNSAFGPSALLYNTTGEMNAAFGETSLKFNTTGESNTAIGTTSLESNTTGSYNTAIGVGAGDAVTTGSNNIIIGQGADPSANNATNQIVIGQGATGTGNNYAVIGNTDITRVYAAQDGAGVLYANATIQSSDRRVKKSINSLAYGLNFIMKLRPVSYYKLHPRNYPQELKDKFYPDGKIRQVGAEDYNKLQVGFIAQEVKAVNDEMSAENNIVNIDDDGFHRMDYEKIVVPLVKAVQEQQKQIEELTKKINAMLEVQVKSVDSDLFNEGAQ